MLSFYQDTGLRPFQAIKVSSKLSQTDLKFQEKSLGIVFWYTMISTKNILLAKIYQKATQLLSCYISTHLVSYFQLDDEKCKMENEFKKLDVQFTIELYGKLMMANQWSKFVFIWTLYSPI